jgi:hypothetical protein
VVYCPGLLWLRAFSYQLSAVSEQLSAVNHRLSGCGVDLDDG